MTAPHHLLTADLLAELSPAIASALATTLHKDILAIATAAVRLYAETHPRPSHVTKTQAAEMLGISPPTLQKLIAAGTLSLNRIGKIPIHQIDAALAVAQKDKPAKRGQS